LVTPKNPPRAFEIQEWSQLLPSGVATEVVANQVEIHKAQHEKNIRTFVTYMSEVALLHQFHSRGIVLTA
jgi:hypothetical protein